MNQQIMDLRDEINALKKLVSELRQDLSNHKLGIESYTVSDLKTMIDTNDINALTRYFGSSNHRRNPTITIEEDRKHYDFGIYALMRYSLSLEGVILCIKNSKISSSREFFLSSLESQKVRERISRERYIELFKNLDSKVFDSLTLKEITEDYVSPVDTRLYIRNHWEEIIHARYLMENPPIIETVPIKEETENIKYTIHEAIKHNDIEGINQLIERGVNINSKSKNSETPLFLATKLLNLDIVNLLLSSGANKNIPNKRGVTPYDLALKLNALNFIKALDDRG